MCRGCNKPKRLQTETSFNDDTMTKRRKRINKLKRGV